jgi:hypothetical protein
MDNMREQSSEIVSRDTEPAIQIVSLPRSVLSYSYRLILVFLLMSGCAATNRPILGDSVTFTPGWSRLKKSSSRALRDPNVWAPLLAAIALQAGDLDEEISDRLREDTPLFGSSQGALDASDDLRSLNEIAYMSTALLVPGPEATDDWLVTKTKLLGMEWLMSEAVGNFTTNIQHYTDREKPNQRNQNSFPSYHATTTIFYGRLADLNTDYLPISESSRQALSYSYDGIAGLTSWARVEAGEHYPSDVLAGWALAHYLGYLATDFIAPDQQLLLIRPQLAKDSTGLEFVLHF